MNVQVHESRWIPDKNCWRLVHPETGDFIAEFYPATNKLVVTKHRKTANIFLGCYADDGVQFEHFV
jgi:hypothetical protein